MEYTEKEKKVIEILENVKSTYGDLDSLDELETDFILDIKEYKALLIGLDLLEKQRKELEMYKRIAEMDLKDGEEFKNEMCNHRCVLKSDLEENYISKDKIRKNIKELKDNRPYLSKFDDWKEKEYTNEDINNMCVEVLEDLLGE